MIKINNYSNYFLYKFWKDIKIGIKIILYIY